MEVFKRLSKENQHVNIYEFGVAFGETTEFIYENAKFEYSYNGFDTFTGLPKAWKNLPLGAISAEGKVPNIDDFKFKFHVGLIEQTLLKIDVDLGIRKFIIFDLDLYSPTLFALNSIISQLDSGDIIYFDEAFDSEERIVINEHFLTKKSAKLILSTVFSACFVIE
jgi:hypothetical protein